MKKRYLKRSLIFIIFILVILSMASAMAMNKGMWFQKNENGDVYVFPITPLENPDEWKALETHDEMVKVTQIPDDILEKISTKGLIETCFNYPLFGDIFAYNSYNQGLDTLNKQFNGFRELYNRKDLAKEIILFYQNIDYKSVINSTDPYFTLRLRFIDYYIAQDEVLSVFSKEERNELLEATVKALESKSQSFSDTLSIDSTLFLATSIIKIHDKELEATIYGDVESVKDKMAGDPKRWGFTDVDEIKRLELSEGLRVNYIDGDKLNKASGKSMIALIDPNKIETWEFTLDLDGNPKVFLTVAFEDGAYRIVHFGGNAETFGAAKNDFKRLTNDNGATVTPILLCVGPTYYLAATIDNKEYVLPVISDSNASKMITNELKTASEIIEMLKEIQQNSLEGERGGSSRSH